MKAPLPLQAAGGHENLSRLHAPLECGACLLPALLRRQLSCAEFLASYVALWPAARGRQQLDLRLQWPQVAR